VGTVDINSTSVPRNGRGCWRLWESLSATPEAIPLTNAQPEELDRRLDETRFATARPAFPGKRCFAEFVALAVKPKSKSLQKKEEL
jgi:Putative addiction module component